MKPAIPELLRRGYSAEDLRKIWGANLMRVLAKVMRVSNKIAMTKAPTRMIPLDSEEGRALLDEKTAADYSPLADYNADENLVLIQEINSRRPVFWADARDVWDAMNQIDKVCSLARGWITVRKPE